MSNTLYLTREQSKISTDDIKVLAHAIIIPVGLTLLTSNALYTLAYVLFTSFIYTKVLTKNDVNPEVAEVILFANKIYIALFLTLSMLVAVALI